MQYFKFSIALVENKFSQQKKFEKKMLKRKCTLQTGLYMQICYDVIFDSTLRRISLRAGTYYQKPGI